MVHLLKGRYVTTEMSHEMLQTSILGFNFKSLFKAKFLLATFHHGWFQTSFPKPLLHLVTHWVLFQSSPSKPPKIPGTQPQPSSCHTTRKGRQWWPGPSRSPKATRLVEESRWLLFDLRFSMIVPFFFLRKSSLPKLWELMTKKTFQAFYDFCSSLCPFRFSLQNAWELQNQIFLKQ